MDDSTKSSSEVNSLIAILLAFPYWGFLINGGVTPNTTYLYLLEQYKKREPTTDIQHREFSSWVGYWIRLIKENNRPGYIPEGDIETWQRFANESKKENDVSVTRLSCMTADQITKFKKKKTITKLREGKIAFEGNVYIGFEEENTCAPTENRNPKAGGIATNVPTSNVTVSEAVKHDNTENLLDEGRKDSKGTSKAGIEDTNVCAPRENPNAKAGGTATNVPTSNVTVSEAVKHDNTENLLDEGRKDSKGTSKAGIEDTNVCAPRENPNAKAGGTATNVPTSNVTVSEAVKHDNTENLLDEGRKDSKGTSKAGIEDTNVCAPRENPNAKAGGTATNVPTSNVTVSEAVKHDNTENLLDEGRKDSKRTSILNKKIYLTTEFVLGEDADCIPSVSNNTVEVEAQYELLNPDEAKDKTSSTETFDNLDEQGQIIDSSISKDTVQNSTDAQPKAGIEDTNVCAPRENPNAKAGGTATNVPTSNVTVSEAVKHDNTENLLDEGRKDSKGTSKAGIEDTNVCAPRENPNAKAGGTATNVPTSNVTVSEAVKHDNTENLLDEGRKDSKGTSKAGIEDTNVCAPRENPNAKAGGTATNVPTSNVTVSEAVKHDNTENLLDEGRKDSKGTSKAGIEDTNVCAPRENPNAKAGGTATNVPTSNVTVSEAVKHDNTENLLDEGRKDSKGTSKAGIEDTNVCAPRENPNAKAGGTATNVPTSNVTVSEAVKHDNTENLLDEGRKDSKGTSKAGIEDTNVCAPRENPNAKAGGTATNVPTSNVTVSEAVKHDNTENLLDEGRKDSKGTSKAGIEDTNVCAPRENPNAKAGGTATNVPTSNVTVSEAVKHDNTENLLDEGRKDSKGTSIQPANGPVEVIGGQREGVGGWIAEKAPAFLAGALFGVSLLRYMRG